MRRRPPVPVLVPALLGLLMLSLQPLALVWRLPWGRLGEVLAGEAVLVPLRLSLLTSLAATLVAIAVGVPIAAVLARADGWAGRAVRALVAVPIVLPPVVAGVALLAAFGRRGLLGAPLDAVGVRLPFSTAGVVVAQVFVALPFLVLAAEGGLRSVPDALEEAAGTLGAGRWRTFRDVVLPAAGPSVAAGAVLAWARALGEFGATITFAGSLAGRTLTVPAAVYLALESDPDAALVLSAVLVGVSLIVLVGLRSRWLPGAGRPAPGQSRSST